MVFSDGKSVLRVTSFQIYTRWGESVFTAFNIPPDDVAQGWDGTHRDEELDGAVFVYHALVEFIDGTKQLFKGDVTLVR
jgi:hypothetical protein